MSDDKLDENLMYLWQRTTELTFHNEDELRNYDGFLYHYTSPQGLLGILQSQKLWATESLYLNDSTEINHGIELAEEIIDEKVLSVTSEVEKSTLLDIKEKINDFLGEVYITCFSENGDLLSQWKGYGSYGEGYSVEFEPKDLLRQKRKFPYVNIAIKKVIYDTQEQRELLDSELLFAINYAEEMIKRFPNSEKAIVHTVSSTSAHFIRNSILRFKNCAFSEEKEWRAIYINNPLSEEGLQTPKFRISNNDIVPYLELDISPSAGKEEWCLPINTIIAGSKQNFQRSVKSVNLLTRIRGIDPIEVVESNIPLQ